MKIKPSTNHRFLQQSFWSHVNKSSLLKFINDIKSVLLQYVNLISLLLHAWYIKLVDTYWQNYFFLISWWKWSPYPRNNCHSRILQYNLKHGQQPKTWYFSLHFQSTYFSNFCCTMQWSAVESFLASLKYKKIKVLKHYITCNLKILHVELIMFVQQ